MGRAGYRVRQFWRALFAELPPEDVRLLDERLTAAERQLFAAMDRADQRHSLDVYHLLVRWGRSDDDLLRAALLHDVGKGLVRVRLWHRVVIVLANVVNRRIADKLGSKQSGNWRYPFYVHRHHAELGAELAERAGCRPRVVDLIRRHDADGGNELAQTLRRADEEC